MTEHNSHLQVATTRAYGVALRDTHVLLVRASVNSNAPGVWWLPGGGIDLSLIHI